MIFQLVQIQPQKECITPDNQAINIFSNNKNKFLKVKTTQLCFMVFKTNYYLPHLMQKLKNKIKKSFNRNVQEQELYKKFHTDVTTYKTLTELNQEEFLTLKYPMPMIPSNNEVTMKVK